MKKALRIIVSISMILALISFSVSAAFVDMPTGEDGAVLKKAIENGLLSGFEDSTIRPKTAITRAQMATIMSRSLGAQGMADISQYTDVKPGDWYYEAMAKAVYMGAFKGDGNGNLNPNKDITRQEAMIVVARIFDLPTAKLNVLNGYRDVNYIVAWAKADVSRVVAGGYIDNTGSMRPTDPMTRLEFADLMNKLVPTYITASGEYNASNFSEGNVLIKADNVTLSGVNTENEVYIGDAVKGLTVFENSKIERIIVRGGNAEFRSGTYGNVRGIGNGTKIILKGLPADMLKKGDDGLPIGSFYAEPGKSVVDLTQVMHIEVK